jgi:uncharacterized protein (DUF302 family)
MTDYSLAAVLPLPYAAVDRRVRDALAGEGFGVLTQIDVQATLRSKLGVELRPYEILGACNPALAHEAIGQQPDIGLLLPCNVVVRSPERDSETVLEILDPVAQLGVAGNPHLMLLAEEVRRRMLRVLAAVSSSPGDA